MSDFNIKVIPRDKPEESKFINFYDWGKVPVKNFEGKIIYMNYTFPGKHIYRPYYVNLGGAAPMSYTSKGGQESAFFTLSDLRYDDVIIHWTAEQVQEHDKNK